MLALGAAGFASASLTSMLTEAPAPANGTQCFGLTMFAVGTTPTALARFFYVAVLASSPAVTLNAKPLLDAMSAK